MRELLSETNRIFRENRIGISLVLSLDLAEIIIISFNPFIIGLCIDGLLANDFLWVYVLIALQILLIAVRVLNKILDTKVYEHIIENESNTYYERMLQTNADHGKISSRLNLVSEIMTFFDGDLVRIIDMISGIGFSLVFILTSSGLPLFLLSVFISGTVFFVTKKTHQEIIDINIKLQDDDEVRENIILSRDRWQFEEFTKKIFNRKVLQSNTDAKAYLITDILQAVLLVLAIGFTIYFGNYTSGQIFTIISYITMLNESVCDINEIRVRLYDLNDAAIRLRDDT